jgi:hypothetical protein
MEAQRVLGGEAKTVSGELIKSKYFCASRMAMENARAAKKREREKREDQVRVRSGSKGRDDTGSETWFYPDGGQSESRHQRSDCIVRGCNRKEGNLRRIRLASEERRIGLQ